MMYSMELAKLSDPNRREENQDACFYISSETLPRSKHAAHVLCVLDGISNSQGKKSSELALRAVYYRMAGFLCDTLDLAERSEEEQRACITDTMREAIMQANDILVRQGEELGTTVSLVVLFDDIVYCANVGDSPVFLVKKNWNRTEWVELYTCQNEAGYLVREGKMTREDALYSRSKNSLQNWVGTPAGNLRKEDIAVSWDYLGGDNILLLGSDGALSVLPEDDIEQLVMDNWNDIKKFPDKLFERVQETDATDNFTVMAQRIMIN